MVGTPDPRYSPGVHDLDQRLTSDELDRLDDLLAEVRPTEVLEFYRVHGLLAAVLTAPTLIPPLVWMRTLLGEEPNFQSQAQAEEVMGLMMRLYNQINDELRAGEFIPMDDQDDDALRDWCGGYLEGAQLDPKWAQDQALWSRILPVHIVATDGRQLIGEPDVDGTVITDVTAKVEQCRAVLVDWCQETFDLVDPERRGGGPTPVRTPPRTKVGRNDPCPCGSGKKYKKCCLV